MSQYKEELYFLLIDQAFAENRYYDFDVSKTQMNEFYRKLNVYCKANGCRLKVKLHPESYNSTWLLQDENIEYIKDIDMISLLKKAKGVFGTTSTLMLPAVYFKPCFLLLIHDSSFQKDMMEKGLANGADFFHFQPDDIQFPSLGVCLGDKEEFVNDYLFKTDGESVCRLKKILEQG